LTASVNRYVFILVKKHFEDTVRFTGYHRKEVADSPEHIQHPVVRETLRLLNIGRGIEIVSVSDVPANAGLGTSSSFTVGLLNALHASKGENPSPRTLAEEALTIERVILKEPGGVQDQYVAAYGGLISLAISRKGEVAVTPLQINHHLVSELENRLLFFYTNVTRTASEIQTEHVQAIANGNGGVIESLHEIKRIGLETRAAFESGNLDRFGRLLDEHWNYKKKIGGNISNGDIDRWYQMAIEAGAFGGKLVGAGGGGFLMLYCHPEAKDRVRTVLTNEELREISLRFEASGSRVILNI
jgi:D-glycero-alpha-D-manno-heptose-7-phosphate kinase